MLITLVVFQEQISWLKAEAFLKMAPILVTLDLSQLSNILIKQADRIERGYASSSS